MSSLTNNNLYKSATKNFPAAMGVGTGCLLRDINDLSKGTTKSCSYAPTVTRQKTQRRTGIWLEKSTDGPAVRSADLDPEIQVRADRQHETTSHLSREEIFLELGRLQQGGTHCGRGEEPQGLVHGEDTVAWRGWGPWAVLVSFSGIKGGLLLMLFSLPATWNSEWKKM